MWRYEINDKDIEIESKISSLYDLADILATAKYDPNETGIEPSYANPNLPPRMPHTRR